MLSTGDILQGRYEIVHPVKKGGMGEVYMAQHMRLRNFVAVKEALLDDEASRRAFEREAQLLANLSHPGLAKVTDYFSENGSQYLVMEYVDGRDLSEVLAMERPQVSEVLDWADQVLDVLEELHGNDPPIIHRDIKPLNMKRTPQGRIKLLDFGLAKGAAGQMTSGHALESVRGWTKHYAPPEQLDRGAATDQRSDLFSLASSFYHLLTRVLPPDVGERMAAMMRGEDPLRFASEKDGRVPVAVAEVLHAALSLDPRRRPPDAATLRRQLREAADASGVGAVASVGGPSPPAAAGRDEALVSTVVDTTATTLTMPEGSGASMPATRGNAESE